MATTPTDDPTMETSGVVVSDVPTMETSGDVSDVPAMATRVVVSASFKITRGLGGLMENAKVNVGKLYLRQIYSGWDANQSDVIQPHPETGLGKTGVSNWAIYDGASSKAKLVAKGQGMYTQAGNWNQWFTLVFEVERFEGSTLQVMGASIEDEENDWAIVGGTGEFEMARGIIKRRSALSLEFFCRMKEVVPAPTKKGPWGGNGGSLWEMEGKSQRLENVTIYHIGAVEGIQFSYVDEDGQIRTTGTWGRIKFGPSEFVKQITGAARHGGWLSQFKIVTSHKTYGPFGVDAGAPSFSYTVREDELVVGFFANADTFVQSIGVCTI
ncbi:hypothetical protein SORBI_3002G100832 [Sorghum bicolor]|uniref:Dirigent protein n=1 Tax=Sorghum bicolor TaxID=4558 RepID=A0A1W0W391_SORBI|nr:hypothetical protein SORBI_3002G100832 [Sorghum bicolor]